MNFLVKLIDWVPVAARVPVLLFVMFSTLAVGAELRYLPAADYKKGYILQLRGEIRELTRDIANPDISPDAKKLMREQLEELLDELCLETSERDPYCKAREHGG